MAATNSGLKIYSTKIEEHDKEGTWASTVNDIIKAFIKKEKIENNVVTQLFESFPFVDEENIKDPLDEINRVMLNGIDTSKVQWGLYIADGEVVKPLPGFTPNSIDFSESGAEDFKAKFFGDQGKFLKEYTGELVTDKALYLPSAVDINGYLATKSPLSASFDITYTYVDIATIKEKAAEASEEDVATESFNVFGNINILVEAPLSIDHKSEKKPEEVKKEEKKPLEISDEFDLYWKGNGISHTARMVFATSPDAAKQLVQFKGDHIDSRDKQESGYRGRFNITYY